MSSQGELGSERDDVMGAQRLRVRGKAIIGASGHKLRRLSRTRFARECAKLDAEEEKAMAEEALAADIEIWPEYR